MVDLNNFYSVFNFIMIACIPFDIFGFIGNILIIRIVHKTREMHTTTNYLIANLAASDSIIILMSSFYSVCFQLVILTTSPNSLVSLLLLCTFR